ncbi:pilus assembly protein PilQ [Psychromonas sp. MB-3u-54]|uniref:type IV pilus secretin PilQ family protein n=1 Tax=Psychromonas sp. MB-3u-54 TaxID=2058319 RepID=UPI000C32DA2D|nr:type IV pilus secretin PilQ family protein [Psychromonas sp. MB-3u-54]PKH01126.1 pilus assembly protein PilQ [Psychromonas sp. MB-3u-54]
MNTSYLKTLFNILPLALLLYSTIGSAESQLGKLDINPLVDGKFELRFAFNESISGYQDKLYYRPNKLVIDVEDASSVLALNPIEIEKGGVNNVATKRTEEGLRLIITLDTLMPYRVVQEDSILLVHFGHSGPDIAVSDKQELALAAAVVQYSGSQITKAATEKVNSSTLSSDLTTPKGYVNSIHSLDFKRGSEGQGKLLVYLDNSSVAVDIRRRNNQLIAEFQSTYIPDELLYIMDVVDFATAVEKVESFKDDGKTRLIFDIKDQYNYRYDQLDTLFMIEISEKSKDPKGSSYQGKAISLNFQDIPVRTVLQLIADFNGFNLVITDSVNSNITLRLDDVPWEQALDIILKVKGLGKRLDGNVLMIAPATELAAKEREQLESENAVANLAPLYSEFIQINYAKVADISAMLSSDKTSLLSIRGAVSADDRTNTLLIKDTAAVIDAVKDMIELLDIPVRQVVIEARMVTVDDSVGEELGIKWGMTSVDTDSGISGSLAGIESTQAGSSSINDRLNVNLPVTDAAGTIAFQVAKLANGDILDLELSALESENKAEIIASPRITTANQQTAYIEQGTEIPYVESASSGATSVAFKKAVLSLTVTPQITPDNKVILDLEITQDSVGDTVAAGTGTAVAINTQKIGTQVLVGNGETLVLGGIYQQRISTDVTKVPLLGDIPYLGALFRTTNNQNSKSELLIFVTPRIVMQTKFR